MSAPAAAGELERAYEAVRAQALGAAPQRAPRGLAVLLDRGIVAWIAVYLSSVARTSPAAMSAPPTLALLAPAPRAELASALAEMALASRQRRWPA